MTTPSSFTPSAREKILFAIPFVGMFLSARFDVHLRTETQRAQADGLSNKVVHLLTIRNDLLDTSAIRDLLSCAFLVYLLSTDRIQKPHLRLASSLFSIYLVISSFEKDSLVHKNRNAIHEIKQGRTPLLS